MTERDPNADDFEETTQSWRVEYEDQEQEDCNERETERIAYGTLPRFDPHKHRDDDYIGLNGETSWILVTGHFSRMKHGDTRVSKALQSTGSGISLRSMLLLAPVNMFSWIKVENSTTTPKCESSSLDLDMKLDLLVLMLPTKMLQWRMNYFAF